MSVAKPVSISQQTLEALFPGKLTDTVCVNLHHSREVWVASLMCAEYLESYVDSIIVRDDSFKPVGILGGIELLDNLRKNPTRDFQYTSKVGNIMMRGFTKIEKDTVLSDLVQIWKNSGRAFSIILNEYGDCSTVSARRLLDLGMRCRTDATVSSLAKRKAITFREDATLGEIVDLMYRNKVRKLLLENSDEFISDRLILSEISKILRFEPDVDYFVDLPVSRFKLAQAVEVEEEMQFNQLCSAMQEMDHPLVLSEDSVFTPWDICLALVSPSVGASLDLGAMRNTCPHCGMNLD